MRMFAYAYMCPQRVEKNIRYIGTGVEGGCKLTDMNWNSAALRVV